MSGGILECLEYLSRYSWLHQGLGVKSIVLTFYYISLESMNVRIISLYVIGC